MSDFFDAVVRHPFMRAALLMAVLASIACGVVGTYVVTRRITYIAGAVAHCVLAGLGAARYCQAQYGWTWFHPVLGAALAALLSGAVIGLVSLRAREREDTIIGAIWSVGMAVGVLFIWKTPGYNEDLMSYLFGNILLVSPQDLWLMAGLDVLIVGIGLLFYNQFLAVCFDEEFARLRGLRVEFYYLLLLALTSLTVVVLLKVVGIIMVIALLTLPAAVAGFFSRTLFQMMLLASLLCMALTTSGLALSYGPSLPAGATTIVLAAAVYLVVIVGKGLAHVGADESSDPANERFDACDLFPKLIQVLRKSFLPVWARRFSMKRKRHGPDQIIIKLREADAMLGSAAEAAAPPTAIARSLDPTGKRPKRASRSVLQAVF